MTRNEYLDNIRKTNTDRNINQMLNNPHKARRHAYDMAGNEVEIEIECTDPCIYDLKHADGTITTTTDYEPGWGKIRREFPDIDDLIDDFEDGGNRFDGEYEFWKTSEITFRRWARLIRIIEREAVNPEPDWIPADHHDFEVTKDA